MFSTKNMKKFFVSLSLLATLISGQPTDAKAADLYSVIASTVANYNGDQTQIDWIANAILYSSNQYGVDPLLVTAVMQAESGFNLNSGSGAGAIGLMQLMPETAVWVAGQLDDTGFALDDLQEPGCNIRYGTWYLSSLKKEFAGNEVLMLAAYNAGRGNVLEWMERGGWDYQFNDIAAIPFQETEEYVRSVLKNKAKYQQLYRERE